MLVDLPPIADVFSLQFDDLPEVIPGRPDYRVVITTGTLVSRLSVIGQLRGNSVILVGVELDLGAGW